MDGYEQARQAHLDLIIQYCTLSKEKAEGPIGQALVQHIKAAKHKITAFRSEGSKTI